MLGQTGMTVGDRLFNLVNIVANMESCGVVDAIFIFFYGWQMRAIITSISFSNFTLVAGSKQMFIENVTLYG